MRYHGQNNLRPSLRFVDLPRGSPTSVVRRVAFNRGYSQEKFTSPPVLAVAANVLQPFLSRALAVLQVMMIERSVDVSIEETVTFRSMLPSIEIDASSQDTVLNRTLTVSSIFWNTHRGAKQGDGLTDDKLNAMIGAIHDIGFLSVLVGNVVAGSERSGFSGRGVRCGDRTNFQRNEVASALAGYWFDWKYKGACSTITNLTAWKIWEYSFYAESHVRDLRIEGLRSLDARAGVFTRLLGGNPLKHEVARSKALVSKSLFVARTTNGACSDKKPGLHTCNFYMAYCNHLPKANVGVYIGTHAGGVNEAPLIFPWGHGGQYASIHGKLNIEYSTFASFGNEPCSSSEVARDHAISSMFPSSSSADSSLATTVRAVQMVNTDEDARVRLYRPSPNWINQADCIDMDCDGPRHTLIRDADGSLVGGPGGAVLPRAELFSDNSFFGVEYKDGVNVPPGPWNLVFDSPNQPPGAGFQWYPNVPTVMRTDTAGRPVNLTATWLARGYGIPREGCTLNENWDAWACQTETSYRRIVIESMDLDHEIRRISPVALSSDDGYTDLLNGAMDHGWCFSYTCLKRLMTFHGIVAMGKTYTIHFTGSNPQTMRLHLPNAEPGEKLLLRIYYRTKSRLQIYRGGNDRAFIEDLNMYDGKRKAQLVRSGRWAPNNDNGGWTEERANIACSSGCQIGDTCAASTDLCDQRGDHHGVNSYSREDSMLEVSLTGHELEDFIEIRTMPTVQISMGLSVSVDQFYKVKDAFVSNIAAVLGINPANIAIVDVVPGNARRRSLAGEVGPSHGRRLLEGDSVTVDFEVVPSAQLDIQDATEREDTHFMNVTVRRSVNLFEPCSVAWRTSNGNGSATALEGVHYASASGTVHFPAYESEALLVLEILSDRAYSETPRVLYVELVASSAVNASVQDGLAAITLTNVDAPAPAAPGSPTATGPANISVSLAGPVWPYAPAESDADALEYEVAAAAPGNASDWQTLRVPGTATTAMIGGLPTYTRRVLFVRARTAASWTAWSPPSVVARTWSLCGDGKRHLDEQCDIGTSTNTADTDGCQECVVQTGFGCNGGDETTADSCSAGCGDGSKSAAEGCDDGAQLDGDGCDRGCRVERGWACSSNEDGAQTSGCAVVCGDGIMAGDETCDSGDANGVGDDPGHGCRADCTMQTGAVCTEDDEQLSTCRLCGNGKLEEGEFCDAGANSVGCPVSAGCAAVTTGWLCSGGSLAAPSTCVGGPASPLAPALSAATTSALTWAWAAPDARGAALTEYVLEWADTSGVVPASNASGSVDLAGTKSSTKVLLVAGGVYRARLKACTAAGCSAFSAWSVSAGLAAPSAAEDLTSMVDTISSDPSTLVTGLNMTVGNITATGPPPAIEAPEEDDTPVNMTAILELVQPDGGSEPDSTADVAAPTTPAPTTASGNPATPATTAAESGKGDGEGATTTTTPATTTPAGSFLEIVINKDQKTDVLLTSSSGVAQGVVIPAGALPSNIAVSIQISTNPPPVPAAKQEVMKSVSEVLTFGPSGTQFTTPVQIVIAFTRDAEDGKRLAVHRYNSTTGEWDEKPGSTVDATAGTVTAETLSFSSYGVFEVPELPATTTTPAPDPNVPVWGIIVLATGIPVFCCFLCLGLYVNHRRWQTHSQAVKDKGFKGRANMYEAEELGDADAEVIGTIAPPHTHTSLLLPLPVSLLYTHSLPPIRSASPTRSLCPPSRRSSRSGWTPSPSRARQWASRSSSATRQRTSPRSTRPLPRRTTCSHRARRRGRTCRCARYPRGSRSKTLLRMAGTGCLVRTGRSTTPMACTRRCVPNPKPESG